MTPPLLLPVNRLAAAKGRLAEVLTPPQRAELALTTLATVLEAAAAWSTHAIVLTADDEIASHVRNPHVLLREVPGLSGLNSQLEAALARLALSEVLVLHADLPLATAAALDCLLANAPPAPSATIVESPDGGTNAMLLRPPGRFPLRYGRASADAHRAAAHAAGVSFSSVEIPELSLDLDTPADLESLLSTDDGRISAAGRLLRSWGFETGLARG